MSKSKKNKKVVVTTTKQDNLKPTTSKLRSKVAVAEKPADLLYGKGHYQLILIGVALIAIGMFLMMGGHNEDPNVWDENVIYNWRRTLLAPIVILAGLIVQIFAILKKK